MKVHKGGRAGTGEEGHRGGRAGKLEFELFCSIIKVSRNTTKLVDYLQSHSSCTIICCLYYCHLKRLILRHLPWLGLRSLNFRSSPSQPAPGPAVFSLAGMSTGSAGWVSAVHGQQQNLPKIGARNSVRSGHWEVTKLIDAS